MRRVTETFYGPGIAELAEQIITMYKAVLAFSFLAAACGNASTPEANRADSFQRPTTTPLPADSAALNEELSFIDGCVDNAKLTLGEQKGYAFCKCLYGQVQAKNPTMDSVQLDAMMQDTAMMNRLSANCR